MLKGIEAAFDPVRGGNEDRVKLGTAISPINAITAQMLPTLIIHGDADHRVPL